jgi:predicted nucleic acid-binding protein
VGRRLIVDTNILIDIERRDRAVDALIADGDDLAIAAVTRAEFRTGAFLTTDPKVRERRLALVARMLSAVECLRYDEETADIHAELLAEVRLSGRPRGAHDLIIAAHARQSGREIQSRDAHARFGDLPGVVVAAMIDR